MQVAHVRLLSVASSAMVNLRRQTCVASAWGDKLGGGGRVEKHQLAVEKEGTGDDREGV